MFKKVAERRKEGEEMKPILDVCCGSKMFYFNKNNPRKIFANHYVDDHNLLVKEINKIDIRGKRE